MSCRRVWSCRTSTRPSLTQRIHRPGV